LRLEGFDPINKGLKQLGLAALTHVRCAQRADVPNTVDPLGNQSSDASDFVERQLGEFVAERRTSTVLVALWESVYASRAG
jgi:hypothetical protein